MKRESRRPGFKSRPEHQISILTCRPSFRSSLVSLLLFSTLPFPGIQSILLCYEIRISHNYLNLLKLTKGRAWDMYFDKISSTFLCIIFSNISGVISLRNFLSFSFISSAALRFNGLLHLKQKSTSGGFS